MSVDVNDSLRSPSDARGAWERAAWQLGVDVASPAANDVDEKARFPEESLNALRDARFLSAMLPPSAGGAGASLTEMVGAIRALAVHCASSALVLAMHSIEIVNLNRHGTTDGLRALAREVATNQLLIANANSEVGLGGDASRSLCAIDDSRQPWTLDKQALAISYGERADVIMATCRRSLDASETDQSYVAMHSGQVTLSPIAEWNTLGLRGTCSRGYSLHATIEESLVFPVPFSTVANDGGGQAGLLLRSAVWAGLAEAAALRAHAYVRAAARRSVGSVPPGANELAKITASLQIVRSLLGNYSQMYEGYDARGDLQNVGLTIALRNLKVTTSQSAVQIATAALEVCGISGYQRESPFSVDRLIRDAHGGLVMVSNHRYMVDNSQLLLARKNI